MGFDLHPIIAGRKERSEQAKETEDISPIRWLLGEDEDSLLIAVADHVRALEGSTAILVRDRQQASKVEKILTSQGIPSAFCGERDLRHSKGWEYFSLIVRLLVSARWGLLRQLASLQGYVWDQLLLLDSDPKWRWKRIYLQKLSKKPLEIVWPEVRALLLADTCPSIVKDIDRLVAIGCQELRSCSMSNLLSVLQSKRIAMNSSGPGVQILTIHTSKGLQFTNVVVAGLMTPRSKALSSDEDMRLCYVALTRAETHIYIPYLLRSDNSSPSLLDTFLLKVSGANTLSSPQIMEHIANFSYEHVETKTFEEKTFTHPVQTFMPIKRSSKLLSFSQIDTVPTEPSLDPIPGGKEAGRIFHTLLAQVMRTKSVEETVHRVVRGTILAPWQQEIEQLVSKALQIPLDGFCLADVVEPMQIEMPVLSVWDQEYFYGIVDLLFRWQNNYYLIDWKSHRLSMSPEKSVCQQRYDLQLQMYSQALRNYVDITKGFVVFIRSAQAVTIDLKR